MSIMFSQICINEEMLQLSTTKVFVHSWILNILTYFLEFNTQIMPDFFLCYYVEKKERNIKLNFEKDSLNFSEYEKKNKQKWQRQTYSYIMKN